jgi:hypothetical protein
MKSSFCYMPTWDQNGKLVKKGSYCNWESVMAHARAEVELLQSSEEAPKAADLEAALQNFEKVRDYIELLTGTTVREAPNFKDLTHFGGTMTAEAFQRACEQTNTPITVVKISPNGEVFESVVNPDAVRTDTFSEYLHKSYSYNGAPQRFNTVRKKSSSKDLAVFYMPCRDLAPNQVASNVFKMQLHGDVLLVQQSREQSWMPRERFVSYSRQEFCDQYLKKRKRNGADIPHLSGQDYDKVRREMQNAFNSYEARMAESAVRPQELSKVMKIQNLNASEEAPVRQKGYKISKRGVPAANEQDAPQPKALKLAQAVAT